MRKIYFFLMTPVYNSGKLVTNYNLDRGCQYKLGQCWQLGQWCSCGQLYCDFPGWYHGQYYQGGSGG
jgi:hypothetical protein